MRQRDAKRAVTGLLGLLIFLALVQLILAPPPTPHSISGIIYGSDSSTQVPLNTRYSINDTVTDDFIRGVTRLPFAPGQYFETINGSNGELVIAQAWNLTHYGQTNVTLLDGMSGIDIYLNKTRASEANITLLLPANNTFVELGDIINVTANITIIGAAGLFCTATLNASNLTVLNISAGDSLTHAIGDIPLGSFNHTTWRLNATSIGAVDLLATASCQDTALILEGLHTSAISNVSVGDTDPPLVQLMSPANNSLVGTSTIDFQYNVSDAGALANCSLVLNGLHNLTNTTIIFPHIPLTFSQSLNDGLYNWSVNCTDLSLNTGASPTFNLSVNVTAPVITNFSVTRPILLNSGTSTIAFCNATITTGSIGTNISVVNATLFGTTSSTLLASSDNNDHYTNASCSNLSQNGNIFLYSCGFPILYYANNASWNCTLNTTDVNNLSASTTNSTTLNELVSIGVNSSIINYGELWLSNTSNTTNITIYNFGNVDMNISVRGFAIWDGDDLALQCGIGNISANRQRYATNFTDDYSSMTNLTNESALVANFTIYQRTDDAQHTNDTNSTFWKIGVPPGGAGGNCSGTIVMAASVAFPN